MGYRNIKKQKKTYFFIQIEDFDFSMSRDNAYYQFYKNAPISFATGQVIVSGMNEVFLSSVEIFPPPPPNTCSIPNLPEWRYRHSLSLLPGGRMVVCGGVSRSSTTDRSCIVWTPGSSSWTNMYKLRSSYYILSVHYILTQ